MTNLAVARREIVCSFRSPRSLPLLWSPAIITSVLVMIRWPSGGLVSEFGSRSLEVFSLFACGLSAVVFVLSPAPAAISLVKERRQGTLHLLLHTPLSPVQIYLGKIISGVVLVGVSLAMTFPAAAACYAMGGITLVDHLGPLYGVLLLTGLQITALCLAVGSFSRNIDSAVRSGYGWTLLLTIGMLGPFQLLQGSSDPLRVALAEWTRHLSPLPALMEIMGQGDIGGQGMVVSTSSVARYFVMGGLSSLVLSAVTIRRLSTRIFDESRASGVMTEDRSLLQRLLRRFVFLVDPQRRSWSIGDWTNPVLIKEFRCRRFGRASWILRLISMCAVASIGLTYLAATGVKNWSVELIGALLVELQMALVVLLAPGLSASLLASERETGGWPLLRMTPQSSFSIATGKLLSVAWTMLLVQLATVPGYLVMIYFNELFRQQVLMVVGSLLLAAVFTLLVSAAIGSVFRRSTPATMTSYAVLTTLTALPILIWCGRDAPFGFRVVEAALLVDPVSSPLAIMEARGFEHYRLVPWNWYFLAAGSAIGFIMFWYQAWRLSRPD